MKHLKLILVALMLTLTAYASEEIPTQEEVAKLYVATFNRAPDAGGLAYWMNEVTQKSWTLDNIAQSFFDQTETNALYPEGTSYRDFIQAVYANLFNREPDVAGWNYWETQLSNEVFSRNSFIIAVINGALDNEDGLDKTILDNKTRVGLSYVEAGLTDTADARTIMAGVTAFIESMNSAVAQFGISLYTAGSTGSLDLRGNWNYTYSETACPNTGTASGQITLSGSTDILSYVSFSGTDIYQCNILNREVSSPVTLPNNLLSLTSIDAELSSCQWEDSNTINCSADDWGGILELRR